MGTAGVTVTPLGRDILATVGDSYDSYAEVYTHQEAAVVCGIILTGQQVKVRTACLGDLSENGNGAH
jgi:hypothetical protein